MQDPVVLFSNLFQSIRVTMHVVMNSCVKCCRLVANLARFLIMNLEFLNGFDFAKCATELGLSEDFGAVEVFYIINVIIYV